MDWVYNHGPWFAAIGMIVADFGIISLLFSLEGRHLWQRKLYKTFAWNDTIFIPVFMAMVVVILEDAPRLNGWYTSRWWQAFLLIVGFAISILTEYGALKNGQYTWPQELSPSKLWHTFIYGIVFYWLTSALIPICVVHQPVWAVIIAACAFAGFASMCYLDSKLSFPRDAHLEGDWLRWDWHIR
ncbi:MAG: hypothetical protein ACREGH_00020 [Minisyncoccia bacterium]